MLTTGCLFKPSFEGGDGKRPIAKLAAGRQHACAIDGAGELWCWGRNSDGQLGTSTPVATGTPQQPDPSLSGSWESVAASDRDTCAIRAGKVHCWGLRGSGPVTLERPAVRIFAAPYGACAIDEDDEVTCWGIVEPGEEPTGGLVPLPSRLLLPDRAWRQLAFTFEHACARAEDGETVCWGNNSNGQLGTAVGTIIPVTSPTSLPTSLQDVAVGVRVTCGTTSGPNAGTYGDVSCLGRNVTGLLSDAIAESTETRTPVAIADARWSQLALGSDHACGIIGTGVACYGFNTTGALGDGFDFHLRPPTDPFDLAAAGVARPTEIVAGHDFTCVRDDDGDVACWGANRFGELGNREIASSRDPVLAFDAAAAEELVLGEGHTCAGTASNGVYCWGDNRFLQVAPGDATRAFVERPSLVTELQLTGVLSGLTAGSRHTCGIGPSEIRCWGDDTDGQLGGAGNPSTVDPVDGSWTSVSSGDSSTCATKEGSLYCWGALAGTDSPTQMSTAPLDTWDEVAVGAGFVIGAGRNNATTGGFFVRGFGPNACPFGIPSTSDQSVLLMSGRSDDVQLAAAAHGGEHACVRSYGSTVGTTVIECFGNNEQGQLGKAEPSPCSSSHVIPGPLPTQSIWTPYADPQIEIATAGRHTCAVVDTKLTSEPWRVFCWGENRFGELGNLADSGVPRQVNDLAIREVATALRHTCVIDARKKVWCWGENRYGELGNGARFHAAPVRVAL